MRGSSLRNLNMFKELIGNEFHKNLTLGMTCWSLVPLHIALDRETELKTDSTFWKAMISKGARVERIPEEVIKARDLVYEIASHDAIALQTQRDVVDLGKSLSSLSVAKTVDYELEELHKQQEAERKRLEEAKQERLAQEERRRELELERIRARNERIRGYCNKQNSCSRVSPFGCCHNPGCANQLNRWTVIWRKARSACDRVYETDLDCPDCCSCRAYDNYWHCGACGNNCGNEEHPAMFRIDNGDDCVIL